MLDSGCNPHLMCCQLKGSDSLIVQISMNYYRESHVSVASQDLDSKHGGKKTEQFPCTIV